MRAFRAAALLAATVAWCGPLAPAGEAAPTAAARIGSGAGSGSVPGGRLIARESDSRIRAHVALDVPETIPDAVLGLAAGRCGARLGRHVVLISGGLEAPGVDRSVSVDTGAAKLLLPRMHSVRIYAGRTLVDCVPLVALAPARKGGRAPTVAVGELRPTGAHGLGGVVFTLMEEEGIYHYGACAVPAAGGRSAHSALAVQKTEWALQRKSGATIASWSFMPDPADEVLAFSGHASAAGPITKSARTLVVTGDGSTIATAHVHRYSLKAGLSEVLY